MTIAEYTSAGIGADFHIKGLDDLYKANDAMDKLMHASNKFKSAITARIDIKFTGFPQLKKVVSMTEKLRKPVNTKVNISTEDFNKLDTHVKEMNRNIANTNSKVGGLGSDIASKLNKPITHTGEESENASKKVGTLHKAFAGGFLGGYIGSAVSNVSTKVKGLTEQAYNAAKGGAGLTKQWSNIGIDQQGTTALMGQLAQIRGQSDLSAGSINNMQRSFYNLTGNVPQTKQLTEAVSSFGKASGASEEQMARVSKMMPQMLAQKQDKSVNTGMFNRMFGSVPALKSAVQKYSGLSQQGFSKALEKGKITGKQLEGYLGNASQHSGDAWKKFGSTMGGQMAIMKGTWQNALSSFGKPLFKSITGAFGAVNKNGKVVGKVNDQVMKLAKTLGTNLGNALGKAIKFISKNRKQLMQMASSIWTIVKTITSGAFNSIKGFFHMFTGGSKHAQKGLNGVNDTLQRMAKHKTALKRIGETLMYIFATKKIYDATHGLYKFIKGTHEVYKGVRNVITAVRGARVITKIIGGIKKAVTSLMIAFDANPIMATITAVIAGISAITVGLIELYKHNKKFRGFVNNIARVTKQKFGELIKWITPKVKAVVSFLKKAFNWSRKAVVTTGSFIKKHFGNLWGDIKHIFGNVWNVIKDWWSGLSDLFHGNFKKFIFTDLPRYVKDLTKLLGSLLKGLGDTLWDIVGGFVKGIWKWIKKQVSNGINDVIHIINGGIKGIDWVMSKFGGGKQAIKPIQEVHLAQGTEQRPIKRNTMAMMNDGHDSPQTHNRELAVLPNGRMFIPRERNWRGMLPAGTHVFSAKETRELMAQRGIHHFSLGTGIKKAWNWTKDKAKDVGTILAHPIKYISKLFDGSHKGMFSNLFGMMLNKVKGLAKHFIGKFGNANNPSGAGTEKWKPLIERASRMMGINSLTGSDLGKILGSISRESSGNATAHQTVDDINSETGNSAQGLLQYVPATFSKYAVSGHKNIMNGLDQLLAMFNDSSWRSDMHSGLGGWSPTGMPKRRNGGHLNAGQMSVVGEDGAELFKPSQSGTVIPHNQTKNITNGGHKNIKIDSHPKFEIHKDMSKDDLMNMFDNYNDNLIDHLNNADI